MFSPNGLRMASRYFLTRLTFGVPAKVSMKLEESGDHHCLVRTVIGRVVSLTA